MRNFQDGLVAFLQDSVVAILRERVPEGFIRHANLSLFIRPLSEESMNVFSGTQRNPPQVAVNWRILQTIAWSIGFTQSTAFNLAESNPCRQPVPIVLRNNALNSDSSSFFFGGC